MFFIIDGTYFTGEISLPNLPVSRVGDDYADFGMAKMIQTVGENNLLVFIDTKTTEYLRTFFGDTLANKLQEAWFDYIECKSTVKTPILTFNSDTPRNVWVKVPDVAVDITFSSFLVGESTPTQEKRFGQSKRIYFNVEGVEIQLRVSTEETLEYFVSTGDIEQELFESHKVATPPDNLRWLINNLIGHDGSTKVSPIANYVWYWADRDGTNYTTSMGEADLNFSRAANGYMADKRIKQQSNTNKQVRAWNGMVQMNQKVYDFIRRNATHYTTEKLYLGNADMLLKTINVFNL